MSEANGKVEIFTGDDAKSKAVHAWLDDMTLRICQNGGVWGVAKTLHQFNQEAMKDSRTFNRSETQALVNAETRRLRAERVEKEASDD